MSVLALDFVPMETDDLEWIAAQDRELYPFPWSEQNFADSIIAGYGCWTLFEGGQRVGYAVLMMVLDEAHILNISVSKARQGLGLGRRLLDHLGAVARAAGARQMFLEVRPSNTPALAMYGKAGFETIGRRKGYYPAVNGREDALVMRLPL
ncbi:MAG: ribosomal protein S18-alanine N-acetyltransferase [Zoogloea sp.]|nr:ribosomal protein S18-alanine N-acetyltransferase [Zoogloea sp.]MDD2987622.1 ribosomal protein S18-alanine N-acetyltransferase [Zoogloea sp.]